MSDKTRLIEEMAEAGYTAQDIIAAQDVGQFYVFVCEDGADDMYIVALWRKATATREGDFIDGELARAHKLVDAKRAAVAVVKGMKAVETQTQMCA